MKSLILRTIGAVLCITAISGFTEFKLHADIYATQNKMQSGSVSNNSVVALVYKSKDYKKRLSTTYIIETNKGDVKIDVPLFDDLINGDLNLHTKVNNEIVGQWCKLDVSLDMYDKWNVNRVSGCQEDYYSL